MNNKLISWLNTELDKRGWSQRELARRAGLSHTTVSVIIDGRRSPTFDFCAAIAKPLGKHPIELWQLAGLLPGQNWVKDRRTGYWMSPLMGELCETVERLPEDKQAHVLDFALFLAQREEAPPPSPVVEETKREEAPVKDQPVIEPPSVEEIEALLKRLSYPVRERLVKIAMGFEELDLEQVRRVLAEFHQESEELVETQAENLGSGNE